MEVKDALMMGGKRRSRRHSKKSKKSGKHSGGFSGANTVLSPAPVGGKRGGSVTTHLSDYVKNRSKTLGPNATTHDRKFRGKTHHLGGASAVQHSKHIRANLSGGGAKTKKGGKTRKGGSQLPALALLGTLLATGPKKHKRSKTRRTRKGMRR